MTIGDGANISKNYPINTRKKYSISQQIITSDKLGLPNNAIIKSIAFYNKYGDNNSRKIKLYLKNTSITSFTVDGNKKFQNLEVSDEMFAGTLETSNTDKLFKIDLTKDFIYTGGNLIICVYDETNKVSTSTYQEEFLHTQYSTESNIVVYNSGGVAYDVTNLVEAAAAATNHLNNIQITYVAGSSEPTPPTVTLTSPENEATDIFNPILSFTLGSADQYQVQMAEGISEFSTLQDWTEGNGSISYQTNLLKSNTTYSWKVIAKNEDGETTSDVFSFTTKTFGAPGAIKNASPENGAQDLINPVLSWTFGENTEQQQLLIDGAVKVDWTNIGSKTNDSYQTSGLAAGEHTWQVNTKNGAGETTGTVYTFAVASLPDNVTAVFPANGATNVSSKTIKWQFAENTTQYRFLYGEAADQLAYCGHGTSNTWLDVTTDEVEVEAPYFKTGTTYYWAVDVKNSVGQRTVYQGGDPITTFSFTTASTLAVSNTAPANGATNLENPVLEWNYVGNAQQYKVYLGTDENNLPAVTEEWTARESVETVLAGSGSYQTSGLDGATKYFWRVDVKDENGYVIAGEVWSFVTTLPAPTNVVATPAQVVPTLSMTYGSTTISWDAMGGANGYNVYLGTEKLNAELITSNSYEIAANRMKLSYNMNPGYDISVEAVYNLGTSTSEAVNVKVTGTGYFTATIYSNDWNNRLAGATVTLTYTEDEFGNVYENDEGIQYTFTTNSNGQIFEEQMGEIITTMKLYNGKYAVVVEKDYYESFETNVTISNAQTTELKETEDSQYPGVILIPNNTYIFAVKPFNATFESIDVYVEASAGKYYVYIKEGEEITNLGMKDFVYDANSAVYFKYEDWANLGKGSYLFGVAKVENQINWSDVAFRNYDVFETEGSWSEAANWRDKELPVTDAEVYVLAAATIEDEEYVSTITIKGDGSLTINGSLTADNVYNAVAGDVIINDGAQLRQNNNALKAKFVMNIENPTNWNAEDNTDGWQFIASPFTNANISNFTNVTDGYDLFKFDGTQTGNEWVNQNKENEEEEDNGNDNIIHGSKEGEPESFETSFVNSRGYLASYETATTATLSGKVNNAQAYEYTLTYDADNNWANFHLLGNPFTFDIDWKNVQTSNLADGFVTIDPVNGYKYNASGTIAVGDGFFVKVIGDNPTLSYSEGTRGNKESIENINLIATGNAGSDNVIINLNEEKEGFNKLDNFNKNIASIFVSKNNKRYGIASYDKDITEIAVCFDAKQMGNYTIAAKPQGEFETLVLVDRFTGIETNLLEESYSFTATSSDSYDRFIVKFDNGQQTTDNSHFAYVSGEELIVEVEGTVQLIDVMGRVIYTSAVTSDNNRIDVSAFDNAAYVVRVVNENGVKVQKIVL